MMELYQNVALTRAIPGHGLERGDIAVLVDNIPHPTGGEPGCLLEVFNAIGESLAIIAVPLSAIEPLRADELLAVRPMAEVA